MFGENLKAMRKKKGYTQEELAIKLNVVRQTISKWEKGLSVPDADILCKIAEILDTKVSVLLGGTMNDESDQDMVAKQLAKISEQLAIKNQRNKKDLEDCQDYFIDLCDFQYLISCIKCGYVEKFFR